MNPQTNIEFTESPLKSFIGEVVGFVKMNTSWIQSDESYEHKIETGIYPVYLNKNSFNEIIFVSYIDATKENGDKHKIQKCFDIVESIEKTAISPGQNFDICISPFIWSELITIAKQNLEAYQIVINKYYESYLKKGNGSYFNNLHMIGYCSKKISDAARTIEIISKRKDFIEQSTELLNQIQEENIAAFFA